MSNDNAKKIIDKINYYADLGNKSETIKWLGIEPVVRINYLFLINKYKSNCLLYNEQSKRGSLLLNLEEKDEKNFIDISKIITKCIKDNVNKIIIPVTIKINKERGHDNLLIYNKDLNALEHFEPHGKMYLGKAENANFIIKEQLLNFMGILNNELTKKGLSKLEIIDANIVCPRLGGFQTLELRESHKQITNNEKETTGYCAMWSLLFAEIMLKFPNTSSEEAIQIIYNNLLISKDLQEQAKFLKSVIRGFTIYMNNEIEKHFSRLFGEQIVFEKLYENPVKFQRLLNLIIEIELSRINNPNYNPEKHSLIYKEILKNKNLDLKTKQETQQKLNILENINVLKNIPITPHSSLDKQQNLISKSQVNQKTNRKTEKLKSKEEIHETKNNTKTRKNKLLEKGKSWIKSKIKKLK